jgi:uncharacterized protein
MKFLFHLGHPAHFHLFINVIRQLKSKGHECAILTKKKDILEELLQKSGIPYFSLLPRGRNDSKAGIAIGMIKTDVRLLRFAIKFKPDVMIGTSFAISHVGKLLAIPSINVNEDDIDIVPLYAKMSYPWASCILAPAATKLGKWKDKSVLYNGYHELAYLHPANFEASKTVVEKYFDPGERYFIMRFARLTAHHDKGITGINARIAAKIISILEPSGKVYITSERELEPEFEQYRMRINPLDIHHVMAFSSMYVGDSQTMAAEAGVLGVPFVRFNDFVGRIGYLAELEDTYRLGFGIKTTEEESLYSTIQSLLDMPNLKEEWQVRRQKMLSEKIDVAAFMSWFIENYPESVKTMKEDHDYQLRFR